MSDAMSALVERNEAMVLLLSRCRTTLEQYDDEGGTWGVHVRALVADIDKFFDAPAAERHTDGKVEP